MASQAWSATLLVHLPADPLSYLINTKQGDTMKQATSRNNTQTLTRTESAVSTEIPKVAVTAIGIASAAIGIWAVACMVAGMINSGGPLELIAQFFKAVSGA